MTVGLIDGTPHCEVICSHRHGTGDKIDTEMNGRLYTHRRSLSLQMDKQACSLFNETYTSVSRWCSLSCIPSAEPAQCSPVSCPRSRNRYHRVLHCRVRTREVRLQYQIN